MPTTPRRSATTSTPVVSTAHGSNRQLSSIQRRSLRRPPRRRKVSPHARLINIIRRLERN